ncbi:MAG: DUF2520 domain-containing protein [Desulfatibacillaceae bacterium]|nr:DUF2520 domain-containing protein [Desulfatibacillaceae bacterium]
MSKPSFAIVGCGTLGTALGRLLFQKGYPVAGVASRSAESAKRLGSILETDNISTSLPKITQHADIVFLTTSDSAIEEVCKAIALAGGFKEGAVVLHCSGAASSQLLDSARSAGAYAGSMHPLQSFAGARPGVNLFEGILVSVEGDAPALDIARTIVADLGANHARVKADAKALYHAAAVVASNYLVTLLDMAFGLNKAAGISAQESVLGLFPLIQGTLGNIKTQGIPNALTGPIARGDVATVRRHIADMQEKAPDLLALYKSLGRATVDVALAKGSLTQAGADELIKLLEA